MKKNNSARTRCGADSSESGSTAEIEKNTTERSGYIRKLFFLIAFLGIFFSYEMGNRPFASPDEGRYVEIPREMVVTGDYVTPRLNGMKYFEKPPLFYWLQAATIQTVGINETSMRFWIVFFAVLGCLSVFFVGAKCYSMKVGITATGILATSLIYYCHSRIIILDLVLSVLLSGSLWAFFLAFVKKNSLKVSQKTLTVLMYALSALACLTKGLIGVVLPGFVVCLWMLFTNNRKKLKEILYLPGILVFLSIFLPWHVVAALRNDDFMYYYFVVEHFLRYTTEIHGRYQPAWFFIPIIFAGMIPWTGFTLVALQNSIKKAFSKRVGTENSEKFSTGEKSEYVFFFCWIFGILGFFSFSHSKLIPYVLPIVPPLALVTSIFLEDERTPRKVAEKNFRVGAIINILIFIVAGVSVILALDLVDDVLRNSDVKILFGAVIGIFFAMSLVLILAVVSKVPNEYALAIYTFLSADMLWTINKAAPYYQDAKKPSVCDVAKSIRMNKNKDDLVFCYNAYYQDFPVYLNDTVGVVNFVGELEFGAKSEPDKNKLISEESFWNLWTTTNRRIFLLLSRSDYREVFKKRSRVHKILDFDKNFVAITNKL